MSGDNSNRNMVIFVFVLFYIYLIFIRETINLAKDWNDLKCNPLYLFTTSLFLDNRESINNFGNCVNNITSKVVQDKLDKSKIEQMRMANNVLALSHDINDYNNSLFTDITNIRTTNNNISSTLNNISDRQAIHMSNVSNYYNSGKLNTFTTTINTIFDNIKTYLPSM